jgi:hypothetical protein
MLAAQTDNMRLNEILAVFRAAHLADAGDLAVGTHDAIIDQLNPRVINPGIVREANTRSVILYKLETPGYQFDGVIDLLVGVRGSVQQDIIFQWGDHLALLIAEGATKESMAAQRDSMYQRA